MSDVKENAAQLPAVEPDSDSVAEWLRRHPDFLETRPEVIASLLPPQYQHGQTVVDMQYFLLQRLQRETSRLRRQEQQLLATVDENTAGQARVQKAVLAIINSSTIKSVGRIVRTRLPEILDIAAAALCAESGSIPVPDGAVSLEARSVGKFLEPKRRITLLENTTGDARIFGAAAGQVQSVAYVRLRAGRNAPVMMLALGSAREQGFHQNQAADLLAFLADVLEIRLKLCLKNAP